MEIKSSETQFKNCAIEVCIESFSHIEQLNSLYSLIFGE